MTIAPVLCAAALAAWLLAIAVVDVRTRRIPNLLVAGGILSAITIHLLAPIGEGLFSIPWGSPGIVQALLGLLTGLGLFMPLYLLRVVGAGDVKLLAMVGVWLGPTLLLGATLLTLVAGGVMAIVVMVGSGTSRQVLASVRVILTTSMIGAQAGRIAPIDVPPAHGIRLPYALAICAGTVAQVGWQLVQSNP